MSFLAGPGDGPQNGRNACADGVPEVMRKCGLGWTLSRDPQVPKRMEEIDVDGGFVMNPKRQRAHRCRFMPKRARPRGLKQYSREIAALRCEGMRQEQ